MDIEDELGDLDHAVRSAENIVDRCRKLADFLAACEKWLGTGEFPVDGIPSHYRVLNHAAFLLGARVADGMICDWWQEQARTAATRDRQEDLRITLFELVPAPPIIWSDFHRLWDFWFDPNARWAVFAAYRWCPRRLPSHLKRYCAQRRRHKRPVPDFSHDEFRDWLKRAKEGEPL